MSPESKGFLNRYVDTDGHDAGACLYTFGNELAFSRQLVGFARRDGGRLARPSVLDHCFVVRSHSVHRIQEAQAALSHRLWATVQQRLTPDCEQPAVGRREPAADQDLAEPEEAR